MKKSAILFAMMFAVALWFGSTVMAEDIPLSDNPTTADVNEFTDLSEICGDTECEALVTDIEAVSATSNGAEITVTVTTCGLYDEIVNEKRMVKYRLHIDHERLGLADYPANDAFTPDSEEEGDCLTSSDDGVMFRVHKNKAVGSNSEENESNGRVYGPGTVTEDNVDPYTLTFHVPYDGLKDVGGNPVAAGNTVHLWVDVQQKQICDRAPNTFTDDEEPFDDTCSKPEETDEVLSIKLN